MAIGAVLQWVALLQQVIAGGAGTWAAIKRAMVDNGVTGDTDALDVVIADAARRKGIAAAEAGL